MDSQDSYKLLRFYLDELVKIAKAPKKYLYDYFDDIKFEIDICVEEILSKECLSEEKKNTINRIRMEMIQIIESFSKECCENYQKQKIEQVVIPNLLEYVNRIVKEFDQKQNSTFFAYYLKNNIAHQKSLLDQLKNVKKILFLNRYLMFVKSTNPGPNSIKFGTLVLIDGGINENFLKELEKN